MKTSSVIIIALASSAFAAPILPSEQKNSNVQASNSPDTPSNWGGWKFPVLPSAPFKRSTPISDPSQNAPAFNDPLEETIPVPKPDVLLPPKINQIPDPARPAGLPSLIARPPLKFDFLSAAPIGPGGEFTAPTEPVVPAQKRDSELPPPLNQAPDFVDPAKVPGPVTAPPLNPDEFITNAPVGNVPDGVIDAPVTQVEALRDGDVQSEDSTVGAARSFHPHVTALGVVLRDVVPAASIPDPLHV